jgi:hypothetical protein
MKTCSGNQMTNYELSHNINQSSSAKTLANMKHQLEFVPLFQYHQQRSQHRKRYVVNSRLNNYYRQEYCEHGNETSGSIKRGGGGGFLTS